MANKIPFFSIIVPCCDVEPYVRECLASLTNQSFSDWECIIGIETSKDRTEEVVHEIIKDDVRFRVFTGPRSGSCSASRNTGIDMAQGEYVIFLDGDDTIADNSLQRLYEKISARPGADLYPCVILAHNEMTGEDETRDNYPLDSPVEMTGPEATILVERYKKSPCPMLQLTVFRRLFLISEKLKCIYGLRRQDSEFSPRALYRAKRVVPLHEPFYLYRINESSVSSSAKGAGYFHKDWAIILKSLLAFHTLVSKDTGFDKRVSSCWGRRWLSLIFYFWFDPQNIKQIPRSLRLETLKSLFSDGFGDFNALLSSATFSRRLQGWWVRAFVKHAFLRSAAEAFFKVYFALSKR